MDYYRDLDSPHHPEYVPPARWRRLALVAITAGITSGGISAAWNAIVGVQNWYVVAGAAIASAVICTIVTYQQDRRR